MKPFGSRTVNRCAVFLCAGAALSACLFDPDYEIRSCEVRCDEACPTGFECRDGFCVDPLYSAACYEPIEIHAPSRVEPASCEPFELVLTATGGSGGEFEWSSEALPDDFELDGDGDRATLRAPSSALIERGFASIQITVRDGFDKSSAPHTLDVEVRRCAEATTPAPEPLCAGDDVEIALQAEHGWGNYRWSITEGELPPGLELLDGKLVGTLGQDATGSYPLRLKLEDSEEEGASAATGDEDTQELELEVEDCLRILAELQQDSVCANDPYSLELEAEGGQPPYAWFADELPDDFALDPDTGLLEGATSRVGQEMIALRVRDADGAEQRYSYTLDVQPCPTMRPQAIVACEGHDVELQLQAEAFVGTPVWEKLRGPGWLSVARTGIVSGKAKAGEGELVVRVSDDGGARESKVPVAVHGEDESDCVEMSPPDTLPPACAGQDYAYWMNASEALVSWYPQGKNWPSWLSLDEDGLLHGVAPKVSEPLDIPLEVGALGTGAYHIQTHRLQIRPVCKFLFQGRQAGRVSLFLGDLRQSSWPEPLPPKDLSPALPEGFDVEVFEPSPDGTRVAFVARPRDASLVDELTLAALVPAQPTTVQAAGTSGPGDQVAVFAGTLELPNVVTIEQMAWSQDSSVLALMYLDGSGDKYVVSVGLAGEQPVYNDAVSLTTLDVQELVWLGPQLCYSEGFSAPPVEGSDESAAGLFCHAVGQGGELGPARSVRTQFETDFEAATEADFVAKGAELFLYRRSSSTELLIGHYYYNDGVVSSEQSSYYGIPDPSFTWIAQPGTHSQRDQEHPTVQIFEIDPAVQTYGDPFIGNGSVTDCHRVDVWEEHGAALGCRDDSGLRIALLDDVGGVTRVDGVADSEDFLAAANSKVFTAGASWFAYATMDGTLRVVDLSLQQWASALALGDVGHEVDMTPLPSESRLLVHSGNSLRRLDVSTLEFEMLGDDLPSPNGCGSDFTLVGPRRWCGGPWLPRLFVSARDGSGVVFPDRSGRLFSVDTASNPPAEAVAVNDAVVTCLAGCEDVVKLVP